jgi:hypothetical protein
MSKQKPEYLVHEFMHAYVEPKYHFEVAADFAAAKLEFVGSSNFELLDAVLSPAQQAIVDDVSDPILRVMAEDCIRNTQFRSDLFVRGRRSLSPAEIHTWSWAKKCMLVLRVPHDKAAFLSHFDPVLALAAAAAFDLLLQAPCALCDLAQLPVLGGQMFAANQLVGRCVAAGQCAVYFATAAAKDTAPAYRLNCAIAAASRLQERYFVLASPLVGSYIRATLVERLVFDALAQGVPETGATEIELHVLQMMQSQKVSAGAAEVMDPALVSTQVAHTVRYSLPMWRQHGLVGGVVACQ